MQEGGCRGSGYYLLRERLARVPRTDGAEATGEAPRQTHSEGRPALTMLGWQWQRPTTIQRDAGSQAVRDPKEKGRTEERRGGACGLGGCSSISGGWPRWARHQRQGRASKGAGGRMQGGPGGDSGGEGGDRQKRRPGRRTGNNGKLSSEVVAAFCVCEGTWAGKEEKISRWGRGSAGGSRGPSSAGSAPRGQRLSCSVHSLTPPHPHPGSGNIRGLQLRGVGVGVGVGHGDSKRGRTPSFGEHVLITYSGPSLRLGLVCAQIKHKTRIRRRRPQTEEKGNQADDPRWVLKDE